jgi:tetratricopeptide (TPR) repeat protein
LDAGLNATARWACDTLLAIPGATEHPKYPSVLGAAAMMEWEQGNLALARRRSDEALAAEQRLGTDPSIGQWLVRSNIAQAQGDAAEAVECARHAVELARRRGDPARLGQALAWSAFIHAMNGDSTAALPDAEEAVILIHRLPNLHAVQTTIAITAFALGDSAPEQALALVRETIEVAGPGNNIAWSIAGDLAARHGDRRDALAYMDKAIDTFHWLGQRMPLGNIIGRVAGLLADRDPEAAAALQGAGDIRSSGFAHAPHTVEAEKNAIAIIDATIGETRRHELYAQGAAMTDTDTVAYAKAAITRTLADDTT